MTKLECLELENQVLRNVIACALESLEYGEIEGENPYKTLGKIEHSLQFQEKLDCAIEEGRVFDYRRNKTKHMKTYYCVTTIFDDRGRIVANITDSIEAEEKPAKTFRSTPRKDIYNDWFESYEEAMKFLEEVSAES